MPDTATLTNTIAAIAVTTHDFIISRDGRPWKPDDPFPRQGIHFAIHRGCGDQGGQVSLITISDGPEDPHQYTTLYCENCGLRVPFSHPVHSIQELIDALSPLQTSY